MNIDISDEELLLRSTARDYILFKPSRQTRYLNYVKRARHIIRKLILNPQLVKTILTTELFNRAIIKELLATENCLDFRFLGSGFCGIFGGLSLDDGVIIYATKKMR